jgi:hypothetical protein
VFTITYLQCFFLSMNYFLKDCNLEDNVVRQILFSEKPHPDQKL